MWLRAVEGCCQIEAGIIEPGICGFISCPEKVIKLPNDKWEDYIPKRPQAEEADGDDEGDEGGTAPNEEIEEEGATINCVSNTQSNRESEDTDSDTNSLEEFGLDEYGDIVQETQLPLTDSQLSTVTVFDPEETQIPGKLYWKEWECVIVIDKRKIGWLYNYYLFFYDWLDTCCCARESELWDLDLVAVCTVYRY